MRQALLILPLLAMLVAPAGASDWPQWRGPALNGISQDTSPPTKWSATENVAWKTPIPGKGHSSPIIVGQKVFLTTAIEEKRQRVLMCLDKKTGEVLWQKDVLEAPLEKKHHLNNYASATPASDGQRIFVTFLKNPEVIAVAYDLEGNEVWRKNPGTFRSIHGWAAAPVLYKDLVILNCDHDGDGYLVALDTRTGEEKWRTSRPNRTRSYCVPLIVNAAGKDQLVMTGSKCVASYDPATGREIWRIDGPTEQFVASPVFSDETIFITAGFPTFHLMGIDPSGSGNVTTTHVKYHEKQGAYVPSPIAVGPHVFMVTDEGQAWCLEIKSGKRLWSQKLGKHHRPSPVYANGNLYFLADDGECFVFKAAPKFELVSRNKLGEDCFASPAISGNQIFIRTLGHLYCIGQ